MKIKFMVSIYAIKDEINLKEENAPNTKRGPLDERLFLIVASFAELGFLNAFLSVLFKFLVSVSIIKGTRQRQMMWLLGRALA